MGQNIAIRVIRSDQITSGGKGVLVVTQCVEDGVKFYYTYALWDGHKTSQAKRADNLDDAGKNHESVLEEYSAKDNLE